MLLVLESTLPHQLERRRRAAAEAWQSPRRARPGRCAARAIPVPGRADRTYPFRVALRVPLPDGSRAAGRGAGVRPARGLGRLRRAGDPRRAAVGGRGRAVSREGRARRASSQVGSSARKGRPVACLGAPVEQDRASTTQRSTAIYASGSEPHPPGRRTRARAGAGCEPAERATRAGFAAARSQLHRARPDRAAKLQIELEAEFFRHGADFLAFDTIVGGGPNSAVLHFPPSAAPARRRRARARRRRRRGTTATRATSRAPIPRLRPLHAGASASCTRSSQARPIESRLSAACRHRVEGRPSRAPRS